MVPTDRAQRWAFEQVGHHDRAVSRVAAQLGVSWHTIMTQVVDRSPPLVDDPDRLTGVTAVGVDENAFLRATGTRHTQYVTGIADLTPGRPPRLVDVVPGRFGRVLGDWLTGRDEAWRAAVVTASLDPFRGHATALSTLLAAATRVLDALHVVKLILLAVDQVRRRVHQELTGHRGRAGDPAVPGTAEPAALRAWESSMQHLVAATSESQAEVDLRISWLGDSEVRHSFSRSMDTGYDHDDEC